MTDRGATAYAYRGWADVERVASEHFGVHTLCPGQRDLIEAVLSGGDAFGTARNLPAAALGGLSGLRTSKRRRGPCR